MLQIVEDALVRSVEQISGRSLTPQEKQDLLKRFRTATGTTVQRTRTAIRGHFGWTEKRASDVEASHDNSGSALRDLVNVAKKYDP